MLKIKFLSYFKFFQNSFLSHPVFYFSIFCICKRVCRLRARSTQVLPYRHFMATAYLRVSLLMGIPIPHTLVQTSKIVATLYIIRKIYFSGNHTWESRECQMNSKSAKKKHQPLKVSVSNIIVLLENQLF